MVQLLQPICDLYAEEILMSKSGTSTVLAVDALNEKLHSKLFFISQTKQKCLTKKEIKSDDIMKNNSISLPKGSN